ncbi:hypothetical protein MSG28_014650 [Choristoneura fumiferana]|uniref:Uncharacterized protein n=1 Tax=Choristoneura fumiferana TaxID=7141 RepID=A0ACC0JSG4_CHOFU|nr:hypothetical protein MSG28_014650 [Choristoneura fumiferana]
MHSPRLPQITCIFLSEHLCKGEPGPKREVAFSSKDAGFNSLGFLAAQLMSSCSPPLNSSSCSNSAFVSPANMFSAEAKKSLATKPGVAEKPCKIDLYFKPFQACVLKCWSLVTFRRRSSLAGGTTFLSSESVCNSPNVKFTSEILQQAQAMLGEVSMDERVKHPGESLLASRVLRAAADMTAQCASAVSGGVHSYDRRALAEHFTEESGKVTARVRHFVKKQYQQKGAPLSYFHLVLDPDSFCRSVENVYHMSFLVRGGAVAVAVGTLYYLFVEK